MSDEIYVRTKTQCQVCGDGYADENLMLGRCCGVRMIEVPWSEQDYLDEKEKKEAIQKILERANKMEW